MKLKPVDFQNLPFGKLFCDYTSQLPQINEFFKFDPFDSNSFDKRTNKKSSLENRVGLKDVLLAYNGDDIHPVAKANIQHLTEDESSSAVITGQQLTIVGGPLFTLYKIITAISVARREQERLGKVVVPVFWLADEDHDFPEIAKIGLPKGNDWLTAELAESHEPGTPAGSIKLDENWDPVYNAINAALNDSDFKEEVMHKVTSAYKSGQTHGLAFAHLISSLFSRFGLVVIGSVLPEAREYLKKDIIKLLGRTEEMYEALESQSQKLERLYHRQATVSASNWFMIDDSGARRKLSYEDGTWSYDENKWTTSELIDLLEQNPNSLSPNVFMRPLLQDCLLPTLAYVGGPGEIAYYAQMKTLYEAAGMQMPIILPRFSATIIESNIARNLDELPFMLTDYSQRIEDLEKQYIDKSNKLDIQSLANEWINKLGELADSHTEQIEAFDTSLLGTLVRTKQDQINAVNNMRQKLIRSAKNQEEVQLKRIQKVQLMLFPNRNLQERELASLYVLNKYGEGILDELLNHLEGRSPNFHYLIEL